MKFKVLDGEEKTVQVGYGTSSNASIPKSYTGNITIPASVIYNNEQYQVLCVGNYAFYGCTNLANVTIPNSVKIISDYAFSGCSSLSNIIIPNSVTIIGVQAFYGCDNLSKITIPDGVTSIGSMAFSGGHLTSIEIPNSVTYIGDQAFDSTPWYRDYIQTVEDGMVYLGKVAYRYKGNIPNTTIITLKDETTCISGHAFYGQTGLTSIELPNSIRNIGSYAFYGCSNLMSINVSENVETIESSVFSMCTSLKSVDIPISVTSIGSNAFQGCRSLTSIVIPDGVTSIGTHFFSGCCELINVNLPHDLSSIGDGAFYGCSKLSSLTIPQGVSIIGNGAFRECISLDSISIPNTVNTIEAYAFNGCYKLGKIVFEDGENELMFNNRPGGYVSYTFTDCHFQKVYNGRKFSWQYTSPFNGCTVDSLIIGANNASRIPCYYLKITKQVTTFSGNFAPSNLTTIIVEDGNIVYDSRDSCNAVIETKNNTLVLGCVRTIIPNSIEAIGNEAFLGCVLKNIDIPQGVQKIGSFAFSCTNLETIKIPKSIVYIGDESFSQCSGLKEFYCYNMPRTFASNIFARTDISNATLYVPSSLVEDFKIVSPWKEFGRIVALNGEDIQEPEVKKCATPTIAIVDGELTFSCETEGVEYAYEVTTADVKKGNSDKVKLSGTYKVTVYAMKDGWDNSDIATLEFTLGTGGEVCDVNKDGAVDVADIATIISKMATHATVK